MIAGTDEMNLQNTDGANGNFIDSRVIGDADRALYNEALVSILWNVVSVPPDTYPLYVEYADGYSTGSVLLTP